MIAANILRRLNKADEAPTLEQAKAEQRGNTEDFANETRDIIKKAQPRQIKRHQRLVGLSTLGSIAVQTTSQGVSAQAHPPWWLAGVMYAWSLQLNRSYTGWKMNFRYFPVRPWSHPVFKAAKRDDVASLRDMFASGEASPYDVSNSGNTLLHVRFNVY